MKRFYAFTLLVLVSCTTLFSSVCHRGRLPGFIPNVGQWPSNVLFMAQQQNAMVWITTSGVVVDEYSVDATAMARTGRVVREHFAFEVAKSAVSVQDGPTMVAFMKGSDSAQWRSARMLSQVIIEPIEGLLHVYSLTTDGRVQRQVQALDDARANALTMHLSGLEQDDQLSSVTPVTSTVYGSYIGGPSNDEIVAVEYLSNGTIIVAGTTPELTFPGLSGGYSKSMKGRQDGFLAALDARLEVVLAYTFVGGSDDDRIHALTKDRNNNVYIAGETNSKNFPATPGATGKIYKDQSDAFVAKFDSTLTKLLVGFYHGGIQDDFARAIAVDLDLNIYVAGATSSPDLPTTFPKKAVVTVYSWKPIDFEYPGGGAHLGKQDGFVSVFSSQGTLLRSRFIGGSSDDVFTTMTIDKVGNVYLGGFSTSADYFTTPQYIERYYPFAPLGPKFFGGKADGVIVKMAKDLELPTTKPGPYSTYFGGDGSDEVRSITVDDQGQAIVTGATTSKNLSTEGALYTQPLGGKDAFVAVISEDGSKLLRCTYYGGMGDDEAHSVRLIPGGMLLIAGSTSSDNFPVEGAGIITERSGASDGFIATLNTTTNFYSTLVSGNGSDTVRCLALEPMGSPYYVVSTTSTNLTTYTNSFSSAAAGLHGYVAKHAFGLLELSAPVGGETFCAGTAKQMSGAAAGMPGTAKVRLEYARAGSNVWQDVVKSVGGRSYSWKIPPVPSGDYVLRVSTIYNHLSQLLTPFTISNPPSVTQQPKDASACDGGKVTLRVGADGAGLKFQWRRNGTNIPGATADSLIIPALDAKTIGRYDVVITGTCTPNATSAQANVTFGTPTVITQQPSAVTVDLDRSFALTVAATGSTLSYQWKKDGSPIQGATAATYSVEKASATDNGSYVCDVTGGCGTVSTTPVSVVVKDPTYVDGQEDVATSVTITGAMPVQDVLYARISSPTGGQTSAEIVDVHGRIVLLQELNNMPSGIADIQLPTISCAPGMYTLRIAVGGVVSTTSFIVR